ncbi:hypothetical protein DYB32_004612 [Aphanomyces invadans]|uniref:START domain-containing protein n=1 Tax=Aphanomyces invadans TaxID=157072 RepID=A0A418AX56_9STRA|nr:hypothetical protein DYB32_004612 [Aphanomyces invadans]
MLPLTGSTFPLPDECFSSPELTRSGEEELIRMGLDALKLLVRETRVDRAGGPVNWTLDHDADGLQIYVGSEIGKAKETVFMSITEMPATLDEAANLHASDTNKEFHEFITKYNPDLCDCRVIKTLAPTTPKHPYNYIGIKWFCLESPPPVRNRDFVFVEVSSPFTTYIAFIPCTLDPLGLLCAVLVLLSECCCAALSSSSSWH